jgi:hypothetical protein
MDVSVTQLLNLVTPFVPLGIEILATIIREIKDIEDV